MLLRVASTSILSRSPLIMRPSSRTAVMDKPASTALIPSFDTTAASLSEITSPFLTTRVSLLTHTLPDSILVGKPTAFSWLIIGPGGCPVFPAGITTSMAAMSPDLAVVFTLPRSRRSASLNGLRSVKRKRFDPSRWSSSFFRSSFFNFANFFIQYLLGRHLDHLMLRFHFYGLTHGRLDKSQLDVLKSSFKFSLDNSEN